MSIKNIISAVLVAAAPVVFAAPPEGYTLLWADEFDGVAVNEAEWNYRGGKAKQSVCDKKWVSVSNGAMRIELTRTADGFSGGGLITKRKFKSGYFEVAVQMDGGKGWHEAFWTTWGSSAAEIYAPEMKSRPRIEIDCFEHYAAHTEHQYSYGTIQWFPIQGNINRDYAETKADLSSGFHVFGFEAADDYIVFYGDGVKQRTVDMRTLQNVDFALWLTCIATVPDAAAKHGYVLFDYLRCYAIDAAHAASRRESIMADIAAAQGAVRSKGMDLWIEAEDFLRKGTWSVGRDGESIILQGLTKKAPNSTVNDRTAATAVDVMTAGHYRLWVRSRDYEKSEPGKRSFAVAVNGKRADTLFGTHMKEGFDWQDGGEYDIPAGMTTIEVIDTSMYYARCDKMLLTTDLSYTPSGVGGQRNAEHKEGWR